MKRTLIILTAASLLGITPQSSIGSTGGTPQWKPRLFLTASGAVWSPGGVDKDRFLASFGGSLSALLWLRWNTQLMLTGSYASLNTNHNYWRPQTDSLFAPDVWDVEGSILALSLEVRRLFPADKMNYLYIGAGLDAYHFGPVEGRYEIYGTEQPTLGTITEQRDPTSAFGAHLSPGLFFLFYPRVSVDVTVRFLGMYDGDDFMLWLEPAFAMGYRLW